MCNITKHGDKCVCVFCRYISTLCTQNNNSTYRFPWVTLNTSYGVNSGSILTSEELKPSRMASASTSYPRPLPLISTKQKIYICNDVGNMIQHDKSYNIILHSYNKCQHDKSYNIILQSYTKYQSK